LAEYVVLLKAYVQIKKYLNQNYFFRNENQHFAGMFRRWELEAFF